ncbi:hypothetical protein ACFLZ4_02625 [Patescibacteria group bacterium]
MPTLAAYFGTSVSSFLIRNGQDLEFVKFPYVYSKGLFSNQCTKSQFYRYLIETILRERGMSLGSCEVSVCGFLEPPEFAFGPTVSCSVVDTISSAEKFYPVFVAGSSLLTRDVISSFSSFEPSKSTDEIDINYLSNLSIFPQMVPSDLSAQANLDEDVSNKVPGGLSIASDTSIVFTGDRFAQNIADKGLHYILMLELIKSVGIYDLYLDTNNKVPLVNLLEHDFDNLSYTSRVGTFINTSSGVECLLTTGVGDDQFFEVKKNRIYVMPLTSEGEVKLSVKGADIGSREVNVSGGTLGLIFDTREQKGSIYSDVKLLNDLLKQIDRILVNK